MSKVEISSLSTLEVMASAFGGAATAETATIPLDTIKVHMQVTEGKYKSSLDCAKSIYKHEGIKGFYKALKPGLLRQFFYGTLRFAIYDSANGYLQSTKGLDNITILDRMCMGVMSGSLAMIIGNPADVVKVRIQSDPASNPRYNGVADAFKKIAKYEGLKGFYQSLPANILRNSVTNTAEQVSYDQIKVSIVRKGWMEDGFPLHFLASVLAGFNATSLASPFDVLKTRIMSGRTMPDGSKIMFHSISEAVVDIYATAGLRGFYKGFTANCQRVICWDIVMFMAKEQFLLMFYKKHMK